MGCYHPMHGFMCQDGRWRMWARERDRVKALSVPCGQCIGCRLDRSRSWAVRCMHEAQLYSANCFITLTYAPEFLPPRSSLVYSDFQEFMKRLRFHNCGVDSISNPLSGRVERPIRFYMAGEYGSQFGRPHFHACIFNYDFVDKTPWEKSPSGEILFRSRHLEELWPFGHSSVGNVTFQSAAYVARYLMKKITGDAAYLHYEWVDPETGEVFQRTPEFNRMSLKPGIGRGFYEKFKSDFHKVGEDGTVYQDFLVMRDGKKVQIPRYYDNIFKVESPFGWDAIQFERMHQAELRRADNTRDRLTVKEKCTTARLVRLKRTLI